MDALAAQHIAWCPFPAGRFTPLQAQELNEVAASLEATPMQVALAGCSSERQYSADPGTSSRTHLAENIAAAELVLPAEALRTLDNIATAALTCQTKWRNPILLNICENLTATGAIDPTNGA